MPRPRKVTPTKKLSFYVSSPVATRLELMLWSPLEGKVPFGAYGEFFEKLLQDYFRRYDADAGSRG